MFDIFLLENSNYSVTRSTKQLEIFYKLCVSLLSRKGRVATGQVKIVQGYRDLNDVLLKNLSVLDEWLGRNVVREGWRPLLYLDISDAL